MTWAEEQAQRLSAADHRSPLETEQSVEPFLRALGDHLVRFSVEFNTAKGEQILTAQRSGTWVSVSTNRCPGGRIQVDYNSSKACVGVLKERFVHAFSQNRDSSFSEHFFKAGPNGQLTLKGESAESMAKQLLEFLVRSMIS